MKNFCLKVFALFVLLSVHFRVEAQPMAPDSLEKRFAHYSAYCSPEKLYLHLDRTYYLAGEKIWLMGYLDNSSAASLLPPSNYIYVEILGARGTSTCRVKIKKDSKGGFPGYVEIPESFKSGNYTLRAYTLWQLNNHPEYMFHQEIKILGRGGRKNDALTPSEKVDVTFYPEGGRHFVGHLSKIGFKALNANGMSVDISGVLVNSEGETLAQVSTAHDGMGFILYTPEPGVKYTLKVDRIGNFNLPSPSSEGATINLNFVPDYVYARIVSASRGKYELFLRNTSTMKHIASVSVGPDRERKFKVERASLEEGINHFILTDESGNIVSERLFYIFGKSGSQPLCSLGIVSNAAQARSLLKTSVSLKQPGNGNPIDGHFSVSVIRGSFRSYVQRDDIVSYMKLSSEIRGHINTPGYYFDSSVPEHERASRLDLLMAIHGWRFYNLKSVFNPGENAFHQNYAKEYFQSICGEVNNFYTGADPKNFIFSVFAPKLHALKSQEVKGKNRYFLIDSLDFEENTGFVIKVDKQKRINNYEPKWSGDKFALPYQYKDKAGRYALATASRDEKIALQENDGMVDSLEAAVVVARSYKDPFDADFQSDERYTSDLETYAESTLLQYIQIRAPRFVYDATSETMKNMATSVTRSEESNESYPVKLIVDGIEQTWDMFEGIKMEEIEKIDISNKPSTFYNTMGGYVAIKVRSGVNIKALSKETEPSMQYFVPLGYQVADYFYSPRYDRGDTNEEFDHRHTIYWNPEIEIKNGKAAVEFCNTDQLDYPYYVRIEGRTKDGRWFTLHQTIDK